MEMENMTRGLGWRFLDLGRRLERASQIVNLFRGGLDSRVKTNLILEPLLEISDSLMTFRRRYFSGLQLPSVLELLVLDPGNPRSLNFQVKSLQKHTGRLPNEGNSASYQAGLKCVASLARCLEQLHHFSELSDQMETLKSQAHIDAALEDLQLELGVLSNHLTHHYFSHTVASVS